MFKQHMMLIFKNYKSSKTHVILHRFWFKVLSVSVSTRHFQTALRCDLVFLSLLCFWSVSQDLYYHRFLLKKAVEVEEHAGTSADASPARNKMLHHIYPLEGRKVTHPSKSSSLRVKKPAMQFFPFPTKLSFSGSTFILAKFCMVTIGQTVLLLKYIF